jgi:phenylalanyl-tRNA synthetase beta chain
VGTLIENVEVKSAPKELIAPLLSIGLRAVNNIVDITNYCLFETGQPLHAFDYDRLEGGRIVVRRALKGERIVTIDGVERVLDPSILVIADAKNPVAIAGVMGGKGSEVTSNTKNILLESAYFDPILIRRAARKLGLNTPKERSPRTQIKERRVR